MRSEDATLQLEVKTVRYFKGLLLVHNKLADPWYSIREKETEQSQCSKKAYSGLPGLILVLGTSWGQAGLSGNCLQEDRTAFL